MTKGEPENDTFGIRAIMGASLATQEGNEE